MLAWLLRDSHDELEADFRQYYGLNLDDVGSAFTFSHAANLAANLPKDSRCLVKIEPDLSWNSETWILRRIDYLLASIAYNLGGKSSQKPKILDPPSKAAHIERSIENTDFKKIAERLGVDYGN